jgi:hypothetical protein
VLATDLEWVVLDFALVPLALVFFAELWVVAADTKPASNTTDKAVPKTLLIRLKQTPPRGYRKNPHPLGAC